MPTIIFSKKGQVPLFAKGTTDGCCIDTDKFTAPLASVDFIIDATAPYFIEEEILLNLNEYQEKIWAKMEEEVEHDLAIGNCRRFETVDEAISFLHS